MTPLRAGIVFNPSKISREQLEAAWDAEADGATAEWFETTVEDPGQGPARAALDAGCDVVIAAGGDGTVRAVAEALGGSDAAFGIVPQGTGNLLARNLGVPLGNPRTALRRILTSEPKKLDMGWIELDGGEPQAFVVMVGFGLDAQMLAATDDEAKAKAGWLAYVAAMGQALTASEMVSVKVTVDDREPREVQAHTVLIGNCGTLQGGLTLFPDAELDDGVLDVLIVSAEGAVEWMDTLRAAVWDNGIMRLFDKQKTATSTEAARHGQAVRIEVELPQPHSFEIDGEEVGDVQRFTARIDPVALRVY
ncbi:diacylglycerol kinase family protein [Microbacterium sp. cx-59]|uniref:diacylglycerol/lipid kinase family protein n=1 Tax=Microbacterium sp. cx-59 TaxID=2891207 RepID=UPI001E50F584|nr:diacylglycerol kinase family protein [Microbacterium sp. cx-59]MCC4908993.1 diacylglycerol kinase [Microbacterium sp. cx-59]